MKNIESAELERRIRALIGGTVVEKRAERAREFFRDAVAAGSVPLVVDDHAYFLYEGQAKCVEIAGDWTYWQPATRLRNIDQTDLFYAVLEFPRTARLQYKLIVDGDWQLDPANPRLSAEGFGVNSEFWMPEHVDRSWLWERQPEVAVGTVRKFAMESRILGERREGLIYTPDPSLYDPTEPLPLLGVHDGGEAVSIGRFPVILDNLITDGEIEPCAALFISPRDRHGEYAFNESYARFCSEEIMPHAIELWESDGVTVSRKEADHCILGASLGGLLATQMLLNAPESWGACIAQSPAYWPRGGSIFRSPKLSAARGKRVILQTGTIADARELTRIMYYKMEGVGADVVYREYPQGHTWGNWRSNLAEALTLWIGRDRRPESNEDGALTNVAG